MKLDIGDLQSISNAILDCVKFHEQRRAYKLIKEKIEELRYVEFKGNAEIQKQFVKSIGKLKLSKKLMEKQLENYEPCIQDMWKCLVKKIDERIEVLKRKKTIHSKLQ